MAEYTKSKAPEVPPELAPYADHVDLELQRVQEALTSKDLLTLVELNEAPKRLITGMVALADGSHWNPGSGAGFYGYYGGSWKKLG